MLLHTVLPESVTVDEKNSLDEIWHLDHDLYTDYEPRFVIQQALNRTMVSFQANKTRPVYRWYKYKEAFSASLIEHLIERYKISSGRILDPFAGSGTTLFATTDLGLNADGIELLPIGQQIIFTKQLIDAQISRQEIQRLTFWSESRPWENSSTKHVLTELRITKGAYPATTIHEIECYMGAYEAESDAVKAVLRFALLCVLESVSYTRKDGQYLRWDYRSGRKQGKTPFDKGRIYSFSEAITSKLNEIVGDLDNDRQEMMGLFTKDKFKGDINLLNGSCLSIMPQMSQNTYDAIITSPPYCNRYDYTRTYALELALLGINEYELVQLRQQMLSCTVENRAKDLLSLNPEWNIAIKVADNLPLLQAILAYLTEQKTAGNLNNSGIPRMVRGYFYEMACIIAESARVLKPNAPLIMVNDNVRYAGASISVDLILTAMAEQLGFYLENILVLPQGKGNSSQQMGEHGRDSLRKCIYVWRKQQ